MCSLKETRAWIPSCFFEEHPFFVEFPNDIIKTFSVSIDVERLDILEMIPETSFKKYIIGLLDGGEFCFEDLIVNSIKFSFFDMFLLESFWRRFVTVISKLSFNNDLSVYVLYIIDSCFSKLLYNPTLQNEGIRINELNVENQVSPYSLNIVNNNEGENLFFQKCAFSIRSKRVFIDYIIKENEVLHDNDFLGYINGVIARKSDVEASHGLYVNVLAIAKIYLCILIDGYNFISFESYGRSFQPTISIELVKIMCINQEEVYKVGAFYQKPRKNYKYGFTSRHSKKKMRISFPWDDIPHDYPSNYVQRFLG